MMMRTFPSLPGRLVACTAVTIAGVAFSGLAASAADPNDPDTDVPMCAEVDLGESCPNGEQGGGGGVIAGHWQFLASAPGYGAEFDYIHPASPPQQHIDALSRATGMTCHRDSGAGYEYKAHCR